MLPELPHRDRARYLAPPTPLRPDAPAATTRAVNDGAPLLRGRMDVMGVLALVRMISRLGKTGQLWLIHEAWSAEIFFSEGQVVSARFGDQRGLAAVGALMLKVDAAEFVFDESASPTERAIPSDQLLHQAIISGPLAIAAPITKGSAQPAARRLVLFPNRHSWPLLIGVSRLGLVVLKGLIPAAVLVVLAVVVSPLVSQRTPAPEPRRSLEDNPPEAVPSPIPQTNEGEADLIPDSTSDVIADGQPAEPPLVLNERPVGARTEPWEYAANGSILPFDSGMASVRTWTAVQAYRLATRVPGRFVAISLPSIGPARNVSVRAIFRKVGGPPGAGYGIIVRDQHPSASDGTNQNGAYYVLEVGDRGEIGIWRRDGDRWIDILPWTPCPDVLLGDQPNLLRVDSLGDRLVFIVNGTQVAQQDEATLAPGGVGVFVGGDSQDAILQRFTVQTSL